MCKSKRQKLNLILSDIMHGTAMMVNLEAMERLLAVRCCIHGNSFISTGVVLEFNLGVEVLCVCGVGDW